MSVTEELSANSRLWKTLWIMSWARASGIAPSGNSYFRALYFSRLA